MLKCLSIEFYYKKTKEKGQGSDEEMASLKRVKEESVKDLGTLLIINWESTVKLAYEQEKWESEGLWRTRFGYLYPKIVIKKWMDKLKREGIKKERVLVLGFA